MALLYYWMVRREDNPLSPRWRTLLTTLVVGIVCMSAIINRGSFVSVAEFEFTELPPPAASSR